MGNRTIERSVARSLYAKFSRDWRDHLRASGKYGKPKSPKRPTFSQWYELHERNKEMMEQSKAEDVLDFLQADPWERFAAEHPQEAQAASEGSSPEERGVLHIDMRTGEETKE
jgi:hypothetical protein